MAEADKLLRGEVSVGELRTEEKGHYRRQIECPQNDPLFPGTKPQARQVAKDQRVPRAPDEEFQKHHRGQLETNAVHSASRRLQDSDSGWGRLTWNVWARTPGCNTKGRNGP